MDNDTMLAYEFVKAHPADAARILEQLDIEETALFLKELLPELAVGVVQLMDGMIATQCLELMAADVSATIVAELPMEIATVLLRRIDALKYKSILERLPKELAESFRLVLRYPEGTAGAIMNPQVFTLPNDITVEEAVKRLQKSLAKSADRKPGQDSALAGHELASIFVVNREYILVGIVAIHQLLIAQNDDHLPSIMQRSFARLSPNINCQAVLIHPGWRESQTLPVVDEKGVFLGAINYLRLCQLESDAATRERGERSDDAGTALGELYSIGLSALIKGAASVMSRKNE